MSLLSKDFGIAGGSAIFTSVANIGEALTCWARSYFANAKVTVRLESFEPHIGAQPIYFLTFLGLNPLCDKDRYLDLLEKLDNKHESWHDGNVAQYIQNANSIVGIVQMAIPDFKVKAVLPYYGNVLLLTKAVDLSKMGGV